MAANCWGLIEAVGDGSVARRGTLPSPAQGHRGAISAAHERRNPRMIISRELCDARHFERQPRTGSLIEVANEDQGG